MKKLRAGQLYTAAVRRLHCIPLSAMLLPFMLLIAQMSADETSAPFYERMVFTAFFLELLLAIPAALIFLAAERISGFTGFALVSAAAFALVFAGTGYIAALCGRPLAGFSAFFNLLLLGIFLIDAVRMRLRDRERARARLENDPTASIRTTLLPEPALWLLLWFVPFYIFSQFTHTRALGDASLAGAILYFFLVLPYVLTERRENYLEARRSLKNIPFERIDKLSLRRIAFILTPCALFAATAVLTAGKRFFLKMPVLKDIADFEMNPDFVMWLLLRRKQMEGMEFGAEGAPPPAWLVAVLSFLENAAIVLACTLILYFLISWTVRAVRFFRGVGHPPRQQRTADGMEDEHTRLAPARPRARIPREAAGIRRRYRRLILKLRKGAPGPSETPEEMERLAGLADTEENRQLHESYERARYGR